jgi:hypothetical protein
MRHAALIAALLLPAAPIAAGELQLEFPLDCLVGETCHIQHLVDRDPGPGVQDYSCGTLSYDGHKGVDIALPTLADMHRGVDVLAAAGGVVSGWRDGVADIVPISSTQGRECGNGVVLRHDDGWETQYCHMKRGSIQVQNGDRIEPGDILGQVGLSGKTEFPHLHLSVRRDGKVIDPFAPASLGHCRADGGAARDAMWETNIAYLPGGLLDAGFAVGIPTYDDVKAGRAAQSGLAANASGLVIYGYGFAGHKDDALEMRITGPSGVILSQTITLEKDQAQFFRATGKRLTTTRWPAGHYNGTVVMRRGSDVLSERNLTMTID